MTDSTVVQSDVFRIKGNTVINLNGDKFEFEGNDILFRVEDGGCLTINGEAEGSEIKSADYIGSVNEGGVLVVNGGDYEAATTCFQSNGGELYITAGKFNAFEDTYFGKYTINFIDSMKTVGRLKSVVVLLLISTQQHLFLKAQNITT